MSCDDENETVTGYYPTKDAAAAALARAVKDYGDAIRSSDIAPPNHDRNSWLVTVVFETARVEPVKAGRRLDPYAGLAL